jgi:hypothetical protein
VLLAGTHAALPNAAACPCPSHNSNNTMLIDIHEARS